MGYTLNGTSIRRPNKMQVDNSTQLAEQRTLSGAVGRDYFGSNKRVWMLSYDSLNVTDFNIIDTIYQAYLTSGTAVTWVISEGNYTVASTNVHVDLLSRDFSVPGSSYLSGIQLILKEA